MPDYQQRLNEFAQGKRLIRLSRPVRDRADCFCDACGSPQPRILYALKRELGDCYYFVGQRCLRELTQRGIVLRAFSRESGNSAFREEMRRRIQETEQERIASKTNGIQGEKPPKWAEAIGPKPQPHPARDEQNLAPAFLIIQGTDYYYAWVSFVSAEGITGAWGYAKEARYEEVWQRRWEGGVILEKARNERPDAAVLSSGPHHQDSGEAKIRESTAGVSRKPSSDCKACGCSSKHLCGLTAWNT